MINLIALFLSIVCVLYKKVLQKLPPGPRGLPFIGDARRIIDKDCWHHPSVDIYTVGSCIYYPHFENADTLECEMMYISEFGRGLPCHISTCEYMSVDLPFAFTLNSDLYVPNFLHTYALTFLQIAPFPAPLASGFHTELHGPGYMTG